MATTTRTPADSDADAAPGAVDIAAAPVIQDRCASLGLEAEDSEVSGDATKVMKATRAPPAVKAMTAMTAMKAMRHASHDAPQAMKASDGCDERHKGESHEGCAADGPSQEVVEALSQHFPELMI